MKLAAKIIERMHLAGGSIPMKKLRKRPAEDIDRLVRFGIACLSVFITGRGKLPKWQTAEQQQQELSYTPVEVQPELPFTVDSG